MTNNKKASDCLQDHESTRGRKARPQLTRLDKDDGLLSQMYSIRNFKAPMRISRLRSTHHWHEPHGKVIDFLYTS